MERKASAARSDLEKMLVDETAEPKALPLSLLEDITSDFSDDQEIGSGGFAVVYKGILGDRAVAVKRLSNFCMDENQFQREVQCLMKVKHKNVVRFLGYCSDKQGSMETYNGKLVMADVQNFLLCFEYIPKGSLDRYIKDTSREWATCYKIIKGICQGLQYLHENHIVHLDLKPPNILLDNNMIPKITDFGLSRSFDENQSRDITKNILGTMGYLAPEFLAKGEIARSADLYSLGVIILEILTEQKGYKSIGDVIESWSYRLENSQRDTLCEQIEVCYEIAIECRNFDPMKRPASAQDIIDKINGMESIQRAEATSSTSGFAVTEPKGKSKTDDPRVFCFVTASERGAHPLAIGQTVHPAGPVAAGPSARRLALEPAETTSSLPAKALEKAFLSRAHSHFNDGLTKTRFNVYYSPKLMYLKVVVISAHGLLEGRSLAPTVAKIQLGGQIRRTKPGHPLGSASPTWDEEFMFVASEPLEDPLVVTVEERVGSSPRRDQGIACVIIPVASPDVLRKANASQSQPVPSKWFSMSSWMMAMPMNGESPKTFAPKIHLRLSLETAYHMLT